MCFYHHNLQEYVWNVTVLNHKVESISYGNIFVHLGKRESTSISSPIAASVTLLSWSVLIIILIPEACLFISPRTPVRKEHIKFKCCWESPESNNGKRSFSCRCLLFFFINIEFVSNLHKVYSFLKVWSSLNIVNLYQDLTRPTTPAWRL